MCAKKSFNRVYVEKNFVVTSTQESLDLMSVLSFSVPDVFLLSFVPIR